MCQQGNFAKLSEDAGAVKDLLAFVNTEKRAVDESANPGPGLFGDAANSLITSSNTSEDDIDAEMAAETASRSPFIVFATYGGFFSFVLVIVLLVAFSVALGIIPVYVQAWTTAVQRSPKHMLAYLGG